MMICFFSLRFVFGYIKKGCGGAAADILKKECYFCLLARVCVGEGGGGGGDIDWFCGQPSGLEGIFRLNLSCLVHGRAIEMYVGGKMVSDWIELLKKFHFGNIVGLCG